MHLRLNLKTFYFSKIPVLIILIMPTMVWLLTTMASPYILGISHLVLKMHDKEVEAVFAT